MADDDYKYREFRRQVLGEFVPHAESPYRYYVGSHRDHRVDAIRYMRGQFRERVIRPAQARDRFTLVSPALAGELEPTAVVMFDRDLAVTIANPVFITRWGHLYVASLASHHVCWCWNGDEWDDLSGGRWTERHERQWVDCLDRARAMLPVKDPDRWR